LGNCRVGRAKALASPASAIIAICGYGAIEFIVVAIHHIQYSCLVNVVRLFEEVSHQQVNTVVACHVQKGIQLAVGATSEVVERFILSNRISHAVNDAPRTCC
jgi:hypothetical protein